MCVLRESTDLATKTVIRGYMRAVAILSEFPESVATRGATRDGARATARVVARVGLKDVSVLKDVSAAAQRVSGSILFTCATAGCGRFDVCTQGYETKACDEVMKTDKLIRTTIPGRILFCISKSFRRPLLWYCDHTYVFIFYLVPKDIIYHMSFVSFATRFLRFTI